MEREQDYYLANEGDVEFCEDVEFETPRKSIDYNVYVNVHKSLFMFYL
jgi:hypothetical protein